jgi:hypothetical protein
MKIIKNVDSFMLKIKRFRNANTGKHWWLINLVFYTILTNNQGD